MIYPIDLIPILDILIPKKQIPFVESIEENCFIPSSKSKYSLWRTPYFRPILERLEDKETDIIGLMIPSQVGKSQLACAIAIEWALRYPSENVLYYVPTENDIQVFINEKLIPSIIDSPNYASRLPKNLNGSDRREALTNKGIKFDNGSEIKVLSTSSKTALISKTASLVILDEYSAMGNSQRDRGDIIDLALTRMSSKVYQNRKLLVLSTPLQTGKDIHRFYLESRQYQFDFPCPYCGTFQPFLFEHLKYPKRPESLSHLDFADQIQSGLVPLWYECPHCNSHIEESQKQNLLNQGEIALSGNNHLSESKICLHLGGLYSLEKWKNILAKWYRAQGDSLRLQEFQTQVLASPWEAEAGVRKLRSESFSRSDLSKGVYPKDCYKVVFGIDIQHDRYYWTALAYCESKKIHIVDWGTIPYDRSFITDSSHWIFNIESTLPKGIILDQIILDSSDGQNLEEIMDLAEALPKSQAIKGDNDRVPHPEYLYKKKDPRFLFCGKQASNSLFDTLINAKDLLFPIDTPDSADIFTHILNVIKIKGSWEDRERGVRTDYRDCIRYALSWIFYQDFSSQVDKKIYRKTHSEQIQIRQSANRQKLNSIMSFS